MGIAMNNNDRDQILFTIDGLVKKVGPIPVDVCTQVCIQRFKLSHVLLKALEALGCDCGERYETSVSDAQDYHRAIGWLLRKMFEPGRPPTWSSSMIERMWEVGLMPPLGTISIVAEIVFEQFSQELYPSEHAFAFALALTQNGRMRQFSQFIVAYQQSDFTYVCERLMTEKSLLACFWCALVLPQSAISPLLALKMLQMFIWTTYWKYIAFQVEAVLSVGEGQTLLYHWLDSQNSPELRDLVERSTDLLNNSEN